MRIPDQYLHLLLLPFVLLCIANPGLFAQPTFSKSFSPASIGQGNHSRLTFTIDNASGSIVSDLAFTDNLPAGVTIAEIPAVSNSCIGGTITAPAGGGTITLTGGSIGAFSSCQISVWVTSSTVGTHMNVSGDLTSSAGNSGTATADLTVDANRPVFSKAFTPNTINLGETSTLTFTIDNSAGSGMVINPNFIDNLPIGLVVANPPNVTSTCPVNVLANAGSNTITGAIMGGGFMTMGQSCTISVDVMASGVGLLGNITDNLFYSSGGPQTTAGTAIDGLQVNRSNLHLQKSFTDDPVAPGGLATLEFTITNFDRNNSATGITFTDDLDAVLSGLTAVGLPVADPCGVGSTLSGTSLLTFTGGSLPPEGSCTFSLQVQVPGSASAGIYPNTSSTITGTVGGSPLVGNTASNALHVAPIPVFTKEFTNDPVAAGNSVTLEFTITNSSSSDPITNLSFIDELTTTLGIVPNVMLPASGFCGAGSTMFLGTCGTGCTGLIVNGGNLPAGGSCTFSVTIDIPADFPSGIYSNTTSNITGTINGMTVTGKPASDDLVVVAGPQITKRFVPSLAMPGDMVDLEFTISLGAEEPMDASNISFTDDLDAVISGLVATGLPMNDICGMGSSISGTSLLTFTGGMLSPGQSCTFTVPVQIPAMVSVGNYPNTTSDLTAMISGLMVTSPPAAADLNIIDPIFLSKQFMDASPIMAGDNVVLEFTIDNQTGVTANNITFSDAVSAMYPGIGIVTALPMAVCGGTLSQSPVGTLNFAGNVPNGVCTFQVTLSLPSDIPPIDHVNSTTDLLLGGIKIGDPARDTLSITPDDPFLVTNTPTSPSCPEMSSNYVADGSISVSVTDGMTCTGTYDITLTPVPGSSPQGNDPPVTTPANLMGQTAGVYVFNGAGAGRYLVTVREVSGCNVLINPDTMTVTVIDALDMTPPVWSLKDSMSVVLADNDPMTISSTMIDLGNIDLDPTQCGKLVTYGAMGMDDCAGMITATGSVSVASVSGAPTTMVTGISDDGNGNYRIDILWGYGPSTVVLRMVDPSGNMADLTLMATGTTVPFEICNGIDDDCDGLIDEADPDLTGQTTYYADMDGDGYGDPATGMGFCSQPMGFVLDNTDCNDMDATINPETIWYADADGDGFGDPAVSVMICVPPMGYVRNADDCDDNDPAINPSNDPTTLNCRNISTNILGDGSISMTLRDLTNNMSCGTYQVMVLAPSGQILAQLSNVLPNDVILVNNVCAYAGKKLTVMISHPVGFSCQSSVTIGHINGPVIENGRSIDVFCTDKLVKEGDIDGLKPAAFAPCFGQLETSFVNDWIDAYECEPGQDTTKIIYREYEAYDKSGRRVSVFDTIVVFRLPKLHDESFFCPGNFNIYCSDTSDFLSPTAIYSNGSLSGTLELVEMVVTPDGLTFLPAVIDSKCGLSIHVDYWRYNGSSCESQYKVAVELKQDCYGSPSTTIVSVISPNRFEPLNADSTYWRCEFWVTDLDTVPPLAICKGEPFFGPWREIDKWTFNTIRDFDFLHEEDFLGGLVTGLPSFEDIVIPDELTMLDTTRAPYSMCYASEKIIENPDIYLGLNTGFMVAESDMEFTFDWDFLLGEFDAQNAIVDVPGAIGLIGYGINGTFYKLVEGVEEPLLDQFAPYQAFLDGVMEELQVDHELCNLNISLLLEDSWGSTTIRLEEGDVLTLFGIWVSSSDAKIQFSGENLISTNTHECSAHAYVPPLIVQDWSGVKQVKASIEGIGTVILSYDAAQKCYVSHEQLKLPYRDDPYQVVYEVYDSCHNIGYEYCYLKVKDRTRPVAVADKGVTVSLSDKKVWVDASVFDEGSYDNCGVNFLLARRTDWSEACLDLCYNVAEEAACVAKSEVDYESAVIPVWTDGHDTLWCLELENDKYCDPVEAHYLKQMQWLCEDELPCGELVYNGWAYDLIKYATINCRDNHYLDDTKFHALIEKALKYPDADPNDSLDYLIETKFKCTPSRANAECILPFTFGRFPLLEFLLSGPSIPIQMMTTVGTMQTMYLAEERSFCGYNDAELNYHLDRWSQIGGGWSDAVPFSCEDACGPVTVEILVMDYWCNWSKAWTKVWVEDKTPVKVAKDVVDGTITCKVYKDNNYAYPGEQHPVSIEYIVDQAKSGEADAYAALDGIFGGYCKAWVDPYGNFVDIDGYEIDCDIPFYDSVCYCTSYYEQVRVYDDHLGYIWVDSLVTHCYYEADTLNFQKGIVAVNCAENVYCEQEVWCDFDHCGQGYIYRKFKIWSACAEASADSAAHIPDTIYRHQKIYVGNECELNKYMFDVPGDVEVFSCSLEYGPDGNVTGVAGPENTGYAKYLFDDDCRIVGIAHEDKVFKIVGGDAACYKILRTWYFADWCNYGGDVATGSWWLDPGIVVDKCVQKIIVTDTVAPVCVITGPVESGDTVTLGACEYTLEVDVDAMDECGLTGYYWELKDITDAADHLLIDSGSDALDGGAEESFSLSIEGLLPGTYKLKVEIQDECTNESYCEYVITVASGKKPTPVCITSLTARLTPWDSDGDGEVDSAHAVVWAYEFDRSSTPACGDDSLAYRIEFLDGTEDDETAAGDLDYLEVGCADVGSQIVRMWVISLPSDTRDYCDAVLVVQSDGSGCPTTQGQGGDVMTYEGDMTHTTPGKDQVRSGDQQGPLGVGDAGNGTLTLESSYMLEQNRPNPFKSTTKIRFHLPVSEAAVVTIYDIQGRVLKVYEGHYRKGMNEIELDALELGVTGVLYYQLETSGFIYTRKMIITP